MHFGNGDKPNTDRVTDRQTDRQTVDAVGAIRWPLAISHCLRDSGRRRRRCRRMLGTVLCSCKCHRVARICIANDSMQTDRAPVLAASRRL